MYEISEHKEFTKDLIQLYQTKMGYMKELINTFEEKTELGMWWDSKVPEKDKAKIELKLKLNFTEFINLFKVPFTNTNWTEISDKDEVIAEVKKYFNFYEEIEKIAQGVIEVMKNRGPNAAEPEINFLREKLKEAIKKATDEKKVVSSSAIYNAHMWTLYQNKR